ncbi:MAG: type II toxin-antitoxin system VapC family toxin [Oceanicaulis sp.]
MLVDTQAAAWFMIPDPSLSAPARAYLRRAEAPLVSMATVWEANIKRASHGDLRLGSLGRWLDRMKAVGPPEPFEILPIDIGDCYAVRDLPPVHGDPFDRMIAAQALRRGLAVVSADPVFDAFGCERVW